MTIASNSVLATCEADAVCNKLSDGTGTINIVGNATGCANTTEVDMACLALPVSWVSFTATPRDKVVDLAWITAEEEGNDRFVVERSTDGRQWAGIGEQPAGSADSDGLYHYAFTDNDPLVGTSFYRLRQQDLDGATDYSIVRQVTFSGGDGTVFPNPAGQSFTISSATPQTVTLHTADGRQVRAFVHNGAHSAGSVEPRSWSLSLPNVQVQRGGLKSGVYWLRFSASGKVVKLVLR